MEMLQALWQGGVTLALFVHLVEFVEHSDVLAFLQATSCFINSSGKNSVQGCTDARVVLFTVAPHVAAALTSVLAQHQLQIPVEWIVPVFPVPPLPPKQQAGTIMCIQGGIDPTRRNYVAIFEELAQLQQQQGQAGGSDVQLWLVGSLKPDIQLDIPKALTRSVKIHSNLAYRVRLGLLGEGMVSLLMSQFLSSLASLVAGVFRGSPTVSYHHPQLCHQSIFEK